MRCKDVERLIMDSSERKLSKQELSSTQQHIEQCSRCASFQDDLAKIQTSLRTLPPPEPSPKLLHKTRMRCEEEMKARGGFLYRMSINPSSTPVPKVIWAALFVLILLTVLVIISVLKDLRWDGTMSFSTAAMITLILQNATMLVFAPILLRKHRWKKSVFGKASLT